jgi:hypothetical protein
VRRRELLIACFALVLASIATPSRAAADGPNRAGVVVSFDDGRSESVCVKFTEAEISGAELLSRAGLPVVTMSGSGGAAVCGIDGLGCENPGDCFCQCHGGGCRYWAYYTLENGAWRYSATGSSLRKVHDGDVDGWAWGAGGIGNGAQPAASRFDEICPPLAPTPAPPVESVATQPSATATLMPVATPRVAAASAVALTTSTAAPSLSPSPTVASQSGSGIGSRPTWQIALFAAVASALAMTSLILFRGRGGG